CEVVALLVLPVARVTPQPFEPDLVLIAEVEQPLPEVRVERSILLISLPVVGTPARCPSLRYTLNNVLRVGVDRDGAPISQGLQTDDGGHELHAVVGGLPEAA